MKVPELLAALTGLHPQTEVMLRIDEDDAPHYYLVSHVIPMPDDMVEIVAGKEDT